MSSAPSARPPPRCAGRALGDDTGTVACGTPVSVCGSLSFPFSGGWSVYLTCPWNDGNPMVISRVTSAYWGNPGNLQTCQCPCTGDDACPNPDTQYCKGQPQGEAAIATATEWGGLFKGYGAANFTAGSCNTDLTAYFNSPEAGILGQQEVLLGSGRDHPAARRPATRPAGKGVKRE